MLSPLGKTYHRKKDWSKEELFYQGFEIPPGDAV
jgi:hypothetical protein